MMVVMLIMSIILAAMAPAMTTRSRADGSVNSSPWRYSPENLSDAYFGAGQSQIAMIGQPNKLETDDAARLILNASASLPIHLSFKRDNTTVGRLQLVDTNLVLGSGSMDHLTTGGSNNISIGPNNLTQVTSGSSNIAVGDNALILTTSGNNNIGIGTALASNVDGSYNVAVGDDSLTKANSSWNTAVGHNAYQLGTGGSNTIVGGDAMSEGSGTNNVAVGTNSLWYGNGDGNVAVGANSNYRDKTLTNFTNTTAVGFSSYASGDGSVAIGYNSYANSGCAIGNQAQATNSGMAIGTEANASSTVSIAIGLGAEASDSVALAIGRGSAAKRPETVAIGSAALADGTASIAIGLNSSSSNSSSVALGDSAYVMRSGGIAIGKNARVGSSNSTMYGDNSIAIGQGASAGSDYSISIGLNAGNTNKGSGNIAIGSSACSNVTGSHKVCIGNYSGPKSGDSWASDSEERIFIGGHSKFNDGNAVLEVHNKSGYEGRIFDGKYLPGSVVVVNGALLVKGGIITSMPWADDGHFKGDGGLNMVGRTGGQLEPINTEGGTAELDFQEIFSTSERGQFRSPNNYTNKSVYNGWSDFRLKYVGKEFKSGLDKIRELKVFNYTFKKDAAKTPHVGVIAQDLEKVFPEAVKKGADGFLTIRMEDMFYAMINAIKELDLKYQAQEKRINELEVRIEKLEARLK